MAKLYNITPYHDSNGETYNLKDNEIVVVGGSSKCDIILKDPINQISRQHALVLGRKGKFYLFDMSLNGTYCPVDIKFKFDEGSDVRLPNVFDSNFFMERFNERYEGRTKVADGRSAVRSYLLELLSNEENIDGIIEGNYCLNHRDIVGIYPGFLLQFCDNLFSDRK